MEIKVKKNMENRSPLAHLLRPQSFGEVVGQDHLFGENGALSLIERSKKVPSMILWGVAGVGKTTIAKLLAKVADADFVMISAVESNTAEIRKKIEEIRAKNKPGDLFAGQAKKTILMVDEIHHFNKTQQDLFLPFVEDGTVILVGTTTENPSFALNSAILSRCKVLSLKSLDEVALGLVLKRAEEFVGRKLPVDGEARAALLRVVGGDARYLLNAVEEVFAFEEEVGVDELLQIVSKRAAHFDNKGEFHYNLISAFHKSLRGSDVDAALYYLARMLVAGQDPLYILRRMARFATEDVGIADPDALLQVMAAKENYQFLGSPEGDYALSHAAIYLASAPKSNASYLAHKRAVVVAKASANVPPPKNILNAPTQLMKDEGYGQGYVYDHDVEGGCAGQEFFPQEVLREGGTEFYLPTGRGFEREVLGRVAKFREIKESKK